MDRTKWHSGTQSAATEWGSAALVLVLREKRLACISNWGTVPANLSGQTNIYTVDSVDS